MNRALLPPTPSQTPSTLVVIVKIRTDVNVMAMEDRITRVIWKLVTFCLRLVTVQYTFPCVVPEIEPARSRKPSSEHLLCFFLSLSLIPPIPTPFNRHPSLS